VLADGRTLRRIVDQHRNLLGVEMEAYGVFAAAEEVSHPRPEVFALKSVVDFADGEKDDRYQRYASYTSARALQRFVEAFL
jgi:nucleoside phosphorylase